MKAVGIVVEYNPFHNGHAYHVQMAKQLTGADVIVAVMSGSFLQRGEPAIVSKWSRTKMALENGVDLIIELPYAFSTQQASIFASGAVSILEQLGVHYICFGSENGNIHLFLEAVKQKQMYQTQIGEEVRKRIKMGASYPKAMAETWNLIGKSQSVDLSQPNNILGFHYIEAIMNQKSSIVPITVPRIKSNYHDEEISSETIASATSIRKYILAGDMEAAFSVMPEATCYHLQCYYETYHVFHDWEHYFPFLKYRLLTMNPADLEQIYEVEEGLEYRLLSYIQASTSFSQFMQQIKSKRYTWTRLQRLCTHILTGTTKKYMKQVMESPNTPYMRILGMSQMGQAYLSSVKKNVEVPILSNGKQTVHPLFELDMRAGAIFASILPEPFRSDAIRTEKLQHPLRYNESKAIYL
ncbi:nucleotidyltransferase [Ectobacillus polymachus]|uniref:nucleotidyltransferase n=1 Tax=Ectobacillus polymachus TaxID=1508806 RepID=UPI003A85FF75